MSFLMKIFGDSRKKMAARYWPTVEKINHLEKETECFSDEEIRDKTKEFRERLAGGETLDNLLVEAFAAAREAARRALGQRPFDVQLIGAMVLHEGKIAEMKTGEGKTLTATLAIYLNALTGRGAHIVTVNDYLAKRDANWMGNIFYRLGMSVGCIQHDRAFLYEPKKIDTDEVTVEMENLRPVARGEAYAADITYGTNNEFGFDYLRDNMAADLNEMVQRPSGHYFAIVDEVDSILIDEARTPLIISAPDEESTKLYETFAGIAPRLAENSDYNIDEKMRTATLTEVGIEKVEKILGLGNIYTEGGVKYVHHLEQALRAEALFKKDRDYVVKDGEILIVDEFTGRLMPGRRYSEGLHQALEAKERVPVQKESRTLATITFQNYFRLYKKLAGMTGTALTSAEEFAKVYKLEVVAVPTNKLLVRRDFADSVYRSERGKFLAVAREVKRRHALGQPVLVGTVSIEKNEFLSALLKNEGVVHELLNAKNHEREAQIIANAGRQGAVTVATNMAGRGVDIILGGAAVKVGGGLEEAKRIVALGGLHIIGTERHEARRIDDQLRGRAGRQGDPGSSQFFVSLEDDLMRIFGSDRLKKMMEFLQMPEDQAIENKMVSRAIESAQAKIEGYNFDLRKHVLEYDDVMNKQRETIYRRRREILEKENLRDEIREMLAGEIAEIVKFHTPGDWPEDWNLEEIREVLKTIFSLPDDARQNMADAKNRDNLIDYAIGLAERAYEEKENRLGETKMRELERMLYLRTIDMFWMEHLDEMAHLRDSVRLRAWGQKDPLVEYKNEGMKLFQRLLRAIRTSFVGSIFKAEIATQSTVDARERRDVLSGGNSSAIKPLGKNEPGRNDPCSCGSGKKYKKCHGA